MKTKIYCPDIECDSCVRVISKALQHREGITEFHVGKDSVNVEYDPEKTSNQELLRIIKEKGYRASTHPFTRKTFKERYRDFKENRHKYEVEHKMLTYTLITFFLLLGIEVLAYFALFKNMSGFLGIHGWWIFYTNIAVVSIAAGIWHMKSYRTQVTSMVGMMIGMTFGMQSGMMIGTILSASNGLFIGGLLGMLIACGVGYYTGKCCGVMGVMEGLMAGMMGGLMGSMIGAMFFVDHILWLMPPFFIINLIIIWGLSYMLFEELIEHNEKAKKINIDLTTFASYCLIATTIITLIIVYGPKTGLAALV